MMTKRQVWTDKEVKKQYILAHYVEGHPWFDNQPIPETDEELMELVRKLRETL